MPSNPRVLVIGLDSATLDLIEPWAEEGHLPVFARMMKTGVYGRLQSVMPVLSPAAWSSFMTGMNPGKHSLFDFMRREEGSYRLRIMRRDHIRAPSIWKILSQNGLRVGVINVPMTYPPEPVNGFLVSGMGTPDYKTFTYPPDLSEALLARGYQVNRRHSYHPDREAEYLDEIHQMADKLLDSTLWLMGRSPWDFFMVVFFDTDQISHYFWRHMDSSHPQHAPEKDSLNADAILKFYQKMDAYAGQLIEAAGQDVTVIILSDHGAGPLYKDVFLNEWLRQKGYLAVKQGGADLRGYRRIFANLGLTRENTSIALRRVGLGRLERWIKDHIGDHIELLPRGQRAEFPQAIDWEHTRAYSFGYQGQIYINLSGREPGGIVHPGEEYESLCQEITEALLTLTDPDDGKLVVDEVLRRDQIFHGPALDYAPDLTLIMRNLSYITRRGYEFGSRSGQIFTDPKLHISGGHRPDGILFMSGPRVAPPGYLKGAKLIDLAPSILHLMSCPVPVEMDGQVLENWISVSTAVRLDLNVAAMDDVASQPADWTEADEQEVVNRLKSLGYLE